MGISALFCAAGRLGAARRGLTAAWLACALTGALWGGTFGRVVAIGGQASDIALDEGRGVLYIANFTANRIEVMNLADLSIPRSINVSPQPASLAISPDGGYLVVGHFGNFAPPASSNNAITVINLNTNTRQTFSLGSTPLGVAFGGDGKAILVTSTDVSRFDPVSGRNTVIDTIAGLTAKTLPQTGPSFPPQITEASIAASGDGQSIVGATSNFGFIYDVRTGNIRTFGVGGEQPPFSPRVLSVAHDGSFFAYGWAVWDARGRFIWDYPNVAGRLNQGSHAVDSIGSVIYSQIPEATPSGLPEPTLRVQDADNGTVREYLKLPENLGGRSVLSSDRQVLYSVSDSGVLVLPVGALNQERRLSASKEDLVFRGNFCDKRVNTQQIVISDPGGGQTDFTLTASIPGITISPTTGLTPAVVQVSVDPNLFSNQKGTVTATITITSNAAVNVPPPIRLLINNREPDQRGSFVSIPGRLVDILADPGRERFYILRQDKNQVLVFNGGNMTQIAALRTGSTPTQMAITRDSRYLLVGHEHTWNINVYDLESLQAVNPIEMPDAHYPLSVAVSNSAILALSDNRQVGRGYNTIDRVDLANRSGAELPSLGPFENRFTTFVALGGSANGATIFGASADGRTLLYNANADAFTVYRKDFPALQGAFAASNSDQFIVDNNVLNSSLVPVRKLETGTGASSGFIFVDGVALRTTSPGASGAGVIQRVDVTQGIGVRPTRTIESPVTPGAATTTNVRAVNPFTRTLAVLLSRNSFISLTQSGFTVLSQNYDAAVAIPRLDRVVNAADQTRPVAPGGLISVFGSDLSPVNIATREIPLPTALGDSCLTVNGAVLPLLFVSTSQVNAQLLFNIDGNATLVLRTPGGVSDNLNFVIQPNAPAIFRNGVAGPDTDIPTIVRAENNGLVTLSNPVRKNDDLVIYTTGLGRTTPTIDAGYPGPSNDLVLALLEPEVFLGGQPVSILFAGLAPGQVGVNQINVRIPGDIKPGLQVPLEIRQGSGSTTVNVRVVD